MQTTDRYTLADLERWSEVTGEIDPPIRLGVFGDPVAHSLSPQMQNAALRAFEINMQYARFHIRANELRSALRFIRELDFVGINLTVPHKIAGLPQIDGGAAEPGRWAPLAMPNGFHGSQAEWDRMEKPLQALDDYLQLFSERHGLRLTKNDRNWPNRALDWGDPIRRGIHISLADEEHLTYSVCLFALEDRRNKRFWKRVFPKESVPIAEIEAEFPQLLERAYALVQSWDGGNLEFATKMSSR